MTYKSMTAKSVEQSAITPKSRTILPPLDMNPGPCSVIDLDFRQRISQFAQAGIPSDLGGAEPQALETCQPPQVDQPGIGNPGHLEMQHFEALQPPQMDQASIGNLRHT